MIMATPAAGKHHSLALIPDSQQFECLPSFSSHFLRNSQFHEWKTMEVHYLSLACCNWEVKRLLWRIEINRICYLETDLIFALALARPSRKAFLLDILAAGKDGAEVAEAVAVGCKHSSIGFWSLFALLFMANWAGLHLITFLYNCCDILEF